MPKVIWNYYFFHSPAATRTRAFICICETIFIVKNKNFNSTAFLFYSNVHFFLFGMFITSCEPPQEIFSRCFMWNGIPRYSVSSRWECGVQRSVKHLSTLSFSCFWSTSRRWLLRPFTPAFYCSSCGDSTFVHLIFTRCWELVRYFRNSKILSEESNRANI